MSKERSRYRKTDITNFSFLFAFGLQKYISPTMQNDLQDNLILLKGVLLSLDKCRFYRYDDKVSRGGPFIPFDFANAHKSWVKLQKSIDVKEAEKTFISVTFVNYN